MEPTTPIAKLRKAIASGQAVFITGTGVSVAACKQQEVEGHKDTIGGLGIQDKALLETIHTQGP